jgi:monovalent cation/hydrogen antiporter
MALIKLRNDGTISDEVLHRLEYELDVEALRLGIGERRATAPPRERADAP